MGADYIQLMQENPDLFFVMLLLSMLITLVAYGTFPIIFAKTRKKSITKKKYRGLCFAYNTISIVLVSLITGNISSGGPYVLWTFVFTRVGFGILENRGILVEPQEQDNICENCGEKLVGKNKVCLKCGAVAIDTRETPVQETEQAIRFCRKCGSQLSTTVSSASNVGLRL